MGYALLWIENLTLALLLAALVLSSVLRIRAAWSRWATGSAVLLVLTAIYVSIAYGLHRLHQIGWISPGLFYAFLWLAICFLLGMCGLIAWALRRDQETQGRRGAGWPRGRLALAAGAAAIVHLMTFWNLDLALRQQMGLVRAEAAALALSAAPPRLAERDNAALMYKQAIEAARETSPAEKLVDRYVQWINAISDHPDELKPDDPQFVRYIEQRGPMLALVREAAARPGCNFERDWARPNVNLSFDELGEMRNLARDLCLEAHYKAARGDVRGALENILAMYRMANHISEEPLLISSLVGAAFGMWATRNLEHLLVTYPVTADELAVLDEWRPAPIRSRLVRVIRTEEAFGLSAFCQIADNQDPTTEWIVPNDGHPWPANAGAWYRIFILAGDLEQYRGYMRRAAELASIPYHEAAGKEIAEPRGWLAGQLAPAVTGVLETAVRNDANQRLAQIALAVHGYRFEHGEFPQQLKQLTGRPGRLILNDPYDNKPLKLKPIGTGLILYSVGPNGKDDAGSPYDEDNHTGDLTFTIRGL